MNASLRDRPLSARTPEGALRGEGHGRAPQLADADPAARGEGSVPPSGLEFEALYRAHFAFVWRTLRRLGVTESALDDAAQEVFVVVHRRFADLVPESSPKAWLYAIAQRVASDHRRSVRRKGNLLPLHDEMSARERTPLETAIQRQANDLVLEFLESLDPDRRTVFILVELEQMSAPEVARIANANLNTVYYRVSSARKAFASFVEQRATQSSESAP
ncbi:MAG: sigma-70 family RNA polymerase sigma factor [Myxococcales bacterium]